MTAITPDDIPTSVTQLIYGDPVHKGVLKISQNDLARSLAHYWPAIEQHIREQVAQEIEQNIRTWDGMSVSPAERARGMTAAAAIARGTDTTRSTR